MVASAGCSPIRLGRLIDVQMSRAAMCLIVRQRRIQVKCELGSANDVVRICRKREMYHHSMSSVLASTYTEMNRSDTVRASDLSVIRWSPPGSGCRGLPDVVTDVGHDVVGDVQRYTGAVITSRAPDLTFRTNRNSARRS